MAVVGVFAFNFTVTLPLLAKVTFHGGAASTDVLGRHGRRRRARRSGHRLPEPTPPPGSWPASACVFGGAIPAVALVADQAGAIILLVPMGAASISFVATNNATLQLRADPPCGAGSCRSTRSPSSAAPRSAAPCWVHQRCHQPAGGPGHRRRGHSWWPACRSSSWPSASGEARASNVVPLPLPARRQRCPGRPARRTGTAHG